MYHSFPWVEWKFLATTRGFWKVNANHRAFFDWAFKELKLRHDEDWYNVTSSQINSLGGGTVLRKYYNSSLSLALKAIYPEIQWTPWRFLRSPRGLWKDEANVTQFLDSLAKEYEITQVQDWSNMSKKLIRQHKGAQLLHTKGGFLSLLSQKYPSLDLRSSVTPSKSQILLFKFIQNIFPDYEVHLEYRDRSFKYQKTKMPIVFDIFIPKLNLALEYQGEQHYDWHYLYGSPTEQRLRDDEKRRFCQKAGISLIEIPYWWDQHKSSLLATIHKFRPDLVPAPGFGTPIPNTVPTTTRFRNGLELQL